MTSRVMEPSPCFFPSLYSQLTNLDLDKCIHFQLIKVIQTKLMLYFPPGNKFLHLGGIYRRVSNFFKVRMFWIVLEIIKNSYFFIFKKFLSDGLVLTLHLNIFFPSTFIFCILRKDNDSKTLFYSYFTLFYFS